MSLRTCGRCGPHASSFRELTFPLPASTYPALSAASYLPQTPCHQFNRNSQPTCCRTAFSSPEHLFPSRIADLCGCCML